MRIPANAKDLFIWGNINPVHATLYREVAGLAGLLIFLYVRWRKNIPDYITKEVTECVKLDNVTMDRYGFGMDRKTKNKALRKLEKEELIELVLIDKSGKAPQARLLVK